MIEIRANNRVLKDFASVGVSLSLNTVASTFSFDGFLNMSDPRMRALFKPYTYSDCQVWYNDPENEINERLITGTIISPGLQVQKQQQLSSLSGYSKTGIFEDVPIPPELFPLQTDGIGFDKITKRICDYFGVTLFIQNNAKADAAKPITLTKSSPGEKVKDYLSKIAEARNITVAHDNRGRLLLYKVLNIDPPKVKIDESNQTLKISCSPNGQGVHSSITVIRQSSTDDTNAGKATVISPFIPLGIKRPLVRTMSVGENIDTRNMAEAIAAREARNFPITIQKEGWTIQNQLIRAGFFIEVTAPSIFLDTTKLVVENITFNSDPVNGRSMTIKAVLPCVYTGKLPSKSPFV